jgi:hypothetical protein
MSVHRLVPITVMAAALVGAIAIQPAAAADWDKPSRADPAFHDRHDGPLHGHRDRRWMRGPPPVLIVPEGPRAQALVTVPPVAPIRPIEPPSRFRYYCREPSGYFPMVATCARPWIELGEP